MIKKHYSRENQKIKEVRSLRKILFIVFLATMMVGNWSLAHALLITVEEHTSTAANGVINNFTGIGTEANPYILEETLTGLDYNVIFHNMPGHGNQTEAEKNSGFWLEKHVTNDTGIAWNSYDNELQEIFGTPSPDGDGLSFAQGFLPRPFSSDLLPEWTEIIHPRDFVNFFGGSVADGETLVMRMIITDNSPIDPFYLRQRPNFSPPSVPEPGTLLLLGFGLTGFAFLKRRISK